MRKSRVRLSSAVLCVTGIATVLVGCGAGDSEPSGFCKSVGSLDGAVTEITHSPVTEATLPAVKTSLGAIDTAVTNLSSSVEAEFADEVDAVEAAASELETALTAAVDKPSPANLDAARTSMRELTDATNNLSRATSDSC